MLIIKIIRTVEKPFSQQKFIATDHCLSSLITKGSIQRNLKHEPYISVISKNSKLLTAKPLLFHKQIIFILSYILVNICTYEYIILLASLKHEMNTFISQKSYKFPFYSSKIKNLTFAENGLTNFLCSYSGNTEDNFLASCEKFDN